MTIMMGQKLRRGYIVFLKTQDSRLKTFSLTGILLLALAMQAYAQPYDEADRGQPGDEPIQEYLAELTTNIEANVATDYESAENWQARREEHYQQYMYMLGLWPLPEKNPLEATVTGTLSRDGYVVEKLHYQSRPQLYVTANLYRPAEIAEGQRLPAVLYVCGHSGMGRDGNKTAFQSHGIWFARHGYVCLIVDTLQLGEIGAIHHGTYREERWWWHSRGYTPAGVECWNGVRGIDYLISRADVDPQRIAVTGISGGGAATFWVAAADERVRVAVPVSGMADLESYVANRVINGHCDCMFLYNTYQWPWTRIAALIAPRPMLFVNSDQDPIFPMDANDRVINRLERIYSLYGKSDLVDSVVSIGGHAYREDIRQAAYRFINMHLQGNAAAITDSEVDVADRDGGTGELPINPEELRVFATDSDLPADELNTTIDEHFVPIAELTLPTDYVGWRQELKGQLSEVSFRGLGFIGDDSKGTERAKVIQTKMRSAELMRLETEPGIVISVRRIQKANSDSPQKIWLLVSNQHEVVEVPQWLTEHCQPEDAVYVCEPHGTGQMKWTTNNPPNYVERSHVLLGRTVDTMRVVDISQVARWLDDTYECPLQIAGEQSAAILAAYASLDDSIQDVELVLYKPPLAHMSPAAPVFLNVLRVCDIPDVLGAHAPAPLTLVVPQDDEHIERIRQIYKTAGAQDKLNIITQGDVSESK